MEFGAPVITLQVNLFVYNGDEYSLVTFSNVALPKLKNMTRATTTR